MKLSMCTVKIEHNNKQKLCNFFVVKGNRQALLGLPYIEILNILTINCNTIDTKEMDKATKCNTNTANSQGAQCEQHYINSEQGSGRPR